MKGTLQVAVIESALLGSLLMIPAAYSQPVSLEGIPVVRTNFNVPKNPRGVPAGPQRVQQHVQSRSTNENVLEIKRDGKTNAPPKSARVIELTPDNYWDQEAQKVAVAEAYVKAGENKLEGRFGAFRVQLSSNCNQLAAVEVGQPKSDTLRSHVLGIYYYDATSGKSALLSPVSDSAAWLASPTEVKYAEAFGNVHADLVYRVGKASFEQDVVFAKSAPPDPSSLGMDPARTYVQVVTEFIGTEPAIRERESAQRMKDQDIDFGQLRMAMGRSLSADKAGKIGDPAIPVTKSWERVGGRTLLIESVAYSQLKPIFAQLPSRTTPFKPATPPSEKRFLPEAPSPQGGKVLVAAAPVATAGTAAIIDYILVPRTGAPNPYVFQSGQTYLVRSNVTLQNVVFQNGAVIKFARASELMVQGSAQSPTNGGPRCILTAEDDHTAGEVLTDKPVVGTYAANALVFYNYNIPISVQNLDIRYAGRALKVYVGGTVTVTNVNIVGCPIGVSAFYTPVSVGGGTWCDVTQNFHDMGGSTFSGGPSLTLAGKQDNDQDLLANIDELTRRKSNPVSAFSFSTNRKDGEFMLMGGAGGQNSNARLEIVPPIEFNGTHTRVQLRVSNTPVDYLWDVFFAPQLSPTAWQLARTGLPDAGWGSSTHTYYVILPGEPPQGFFQVFVAEDLDYDGVQDGYEIAVLKTATGNPDSDSTRDANQDGQPDYPGLGNNSIADGDEDFDQDGMSTIYELRIGVNPIVAQSPTDSDGDGLPNWLESLITFYTGDADPTAAEDSDLDGRGNFSEWSMRLDPSWGYDPEFDANFNAMEDFQRVILHQTFSMNAPQGFAASANPEDAYTDTSLTDYGSAAHLHIAKDTDANGNPAPGIDTWKWSVGFMNPTGPVGLADVPPPDPADGGLEWDDVLLQATSLLGNVWSAAKVNEKLETVRHASLVYLQHRSFHRISIHYRAIQLITVAQELPQGVLLRVKPILASIHTEATIFRQTTLQIALRFGSTDAFARIGRFVPYIGAIASVLSAAESARENVVPAWELYILHVQRRCDDSYDSAADLAYALGTVWDNAFPGVIITNMWAYWWDELSKFDGWSSACF
jgi:hypothetical protein